MRKAQKNELYYEKTAGEMVQTYWCRKNLPEMSCCFHCDRTQANIVRWLRLPHFMLHWQTAEQVSSWKDQLLAEFHEQVTLYLPTPVVELYLEVSTAYHMHFVRKVDAPRLCKHRNDSGLLSCSRRVNPRCDGFCSNIHFHAAETIDLSEN